MKPLFQLLFWINLGLAILCGVVLVRDFIHGDHTSASKSLFAVGIWLAFASFCRHQVTRIRHQAEQLLNELRQLGFEQAIRKARATSASIPRSLVAEKVNLQGEQWYAFERNSIQFLVAESHDGSRARVEIIR